MPSKQELINYIHAKQRETRILSANHLEEIDNKRLKFIKLKEHADNFLNTNLEYYNRFIMMSGLRGVGKTTILYQLYDYLTKQKNVPEDNIFYLDVHDLKRTFTKQFPQVWTKKSSFLLMKRNWMKTGQITHDCSLIKHSIYS